MANTLKESPNAKINKTILTKYLALPIPKNKCQATYVWIDWYGIKLRCKSRTLDFIPEKAEECPVWILDAPQASFKEMGAEADTYITPVRIYPDPFRPGSNKLVFCATYTQSGVPMDSNHRHKCLEAMEQAKDSKPWFGLEQEYTLLDSDGRPLGWPRNGFPPAQSKPYPYFCGVGASCAVGRELVEAHYRACLYAGIDLAGTNAELAIGQWEYQVGPTEGIKAADDLFMARYILEAIAEEYGITISLDPKPIPDWGGCGGHVNFSTEEMRQPGGIKEIYKACDKLAKCHDIHVKLYDSNGGEDNKRRLIGKDETSCFETFSSGVGDRSASVRIPRAVANEGKGYLEDRRPASNFDPYLVCECLVRTICLNEF